MLVEALIVGGRSSAATGLRSNQLLTAHVRSCAKNRLSIMGAMGALRSVAAEGPLSIAPCQVSQIGPKIDQDLIGCDVA